MYAAVRFAIAFVIVCSLSAVHSGRASASATGTSNDIHAQLSWTPSPDSPQADLAQAGAAGTLYVLLLDHVTSYAGGEIDLRWIACGDGTTLAGTAFRSAGGTGCTYLNLGLVSPIVLADEPGHFHAEWTNSQADSTCDAGAVIALQFDFGACEGLPASFGLCSLSIIDAAGVATALDPGELGAPATVAGGAGAVRCPALPLLLEVPPAMSAIEGDTLRLQVRASGGVPPYAFSSPSQLPAGAQLSAGGWFLWPIASNETQVGTHPLQFVATDASGATASAWTTFTVSTCHIVTFDPIAPQNAYEGTLFRLPLHAASLSGVALAYTLLQPVPPGAHITLADDMAYFDWIPAYNAADVNGGVWSGLRVSASDGVANATQVFSITVHEARPPVDTAPEIAAIDAQGVVEGQTLVVTPTASDAEGDAIAWSGENLPDGCTVDAISGTLRWTPDARAGSVNGGLYDEVTLAGDDGFGGVTRVSFPITVFDQAPAIVPTGDGCASGICAHFCTNQALTTTLHAVNDEDDVPLVWSAAGLPDWLTLDPATGVLSGIAPDAYFGQQLTATVFATDAVSAASASATLSFAVDCTPVRPAGGSDGGTPRAGALRVAAPVASGPVELSWTLARSAEVTLVAYDGAGRAVRHLAHGTFAAGRGTLRWDGRDDGGARVPSGVYYVRGELDAAPAMVRCVLLR